MAKMSKSKSRKTMHANITQKRKILNNKVTKAFKKFKSASAHSTTNLGLPKNATSKEKYDAFIELVSSIDTGKSKADKVINSIAKTDLEDIAREMVTQLQDDSFKQEDLMPMFLAYCKLGAVPDKNKPSQELLVSIGGEYKAKDVAFKTEKVEVEASSKHITIFNELASTEVTYIEGLKAIVSATEHMALPGFKDFIDAVEASQAAHESFLNAVQQEAKNDPPNPGNLLETYEQLQARDVKCTELFRDHILNAEVPKTIDKTFMDANQGKNFLAYAVSIVQRHPRYVMLADEFAKRVPLDSPSHAGANAFRVAADSTSHAIDRASSLDETASVASPVDARDEIDDSLSPADFASSLSDFPAAEGAQPRQQAWQLYVQSNDVTVEQGFDIAFKQLQDHLAESAPSDEPVQTLAQHLRQSSAPTTVVLQDAFVRQFQQNDSAKQSWENIVTLLQEPNPSPNAVMSQFQAIMNSDNYLHAVEPLVQSIKQAKMDRGMPEAQALEIASRFAVTQVCFNAMTSVLREMPEFQKNNQPDMAKIVPLMTQVKSMYQSNVGGKIELTDAAKAILPDHLKPESAEPMQPSQQSQSPAAQAIAPSLNLNNPQDVQNLSKVLRGMTKTFANQFPDDFAKTAELLDNMCAFKPPLNIGLEGLSLFEESFNEFITNLNNEGQPTAP